MELKLTSHNSNHLVNGEDVDTNRGDLQHVGIARLSLVGNLKIVVWINKIRLQCV